MAYRTIRLAAYLCVVICSVSRVAAGATICVSPKPNSGCPFSTISAAVAAASPGDVIQVSQGTYREDVVIGKALSLIGANRSNTIIDATGLANGIYVDGRDNPGLNSVFISGFTVQSANFEGILVTNASYITITDTHVVKNNLSLNLDEGTCPGIPDFETAESFDCGEGIHLI